MPVSHFVILSPQLSDLKQQFERVSAHAAKLTNDHSHEQLVRRPQPQSWSIAQCIVHLTRTTHVYIPMFNDALDRSRVKGLKAPGPYHMDIGARLFRWALEPPVRLRVKTSGSLQPLDVEPLQSMLAEFLKSQEELIQILEDADGLDLSHIKLVSPFSKRVRYNVYSVFHILAAHQRRHLWQAEQVRKQLSIIVP
ncbi:MAG: DinB family protein [Ignavibacteriae bacterium]|nr:DinB family protein [Ignavibacteria bacterium]MBI3363390.1 DinB family protein [Ignavibacteriota bacterium]